MDDGQSGGGGFDGGEYFAGTEVAGKDGADAGAEGFRAPGGLQIGRENDHGGRRGASGQGEQVLRRLVVVRLKRGEDDIGLEAIDGGFEIGERDAGDDVVGSGKGSESGAGERGRSGDE